MGSPCSAVCREIGKTLYRERSPLEVSRGSVLEDPGRERKKQILNTSTLCLKINKAVRRAAPVSAPNSKLHQLMWELQPGALQW